MEPNQQSQKTCQSQQIQVQQSSESVTTQIKQRIGSFKAPEDFPKTASIRDCDFYITKELQGYVLHVDVYSKRRFWFFGDRRVIASLVINLSEYGIAKDDDITNYSCNLYINDEKGLDFTFSNRVGSDPKWMVCYPLNISPKGEYTNIEPEVR